MFKSKQILHISDRKWDTTSQNVIEPKNGILLYMPNVCHLILPKTVCMFLHCAVFYHCILKIALN